MILANEDLTKALDFLPSAPKVLVGLAEKIEQSEIDLEQITEVLHHDTSLSRSLLAAVNTDVYAGAEPIDSLDVAVARLGQRETFRVVGGIAAAQLASEPLPLYGAPARTMRGSLLFTALIAEQLAIEAGVDSYFAFVAGLMRSIGKLVLNHTVYHTSEIVFDSATGRALADWESDALGYANNDVGAEVLASWGFPEAIVGAVRDHYTPALDGSALSLLLNIAAGAADQESSGFCGESPYWQFIDAHLKAVHLTPEQFESAITKARRELTRLSAALDAVRVTSDL